ncbi:MAG: hypothetical protein KDA96_25070, partial [Planctomycetaceae bacterium]|nr:hypothetical protein [Planctomycetaceae bacterium]
MRHCLILLSLIVIAASHAAAADESATVDSSNRFDRRIAPILASHCFSCHSGSDAKGGLDLSRRDSAFRGGESGPVISPGKPEDSLLWQHVEGETMPPKKPLGAAEKELLEGWIAQGAVWGTEEIDPFRYTTDTRAGTDWWSLQALTAPTPPALPADDWSRNAIDPFVLRTL